MLERRALTIAFLIAALAGCSSAPQDRIVAPHSQPPGGGAVVRNEDFSGRQVFPPDNWWNLDVSSAPLDSQSQAIVDWISGRPQNPGGRAPLHPDFGPPPYGMPYIGVSSSQPLEPVTFAPYGNQSDPGAPGAPPGYPIPLDTRTQPGWIEGGVAGGGPSGDRHLLVIDRDRWLLFETWATRWNPASARWEAGSGAVFDLSTNARRTEGWTSADAAGLAIFPGLIRADEVFGPNEIRHAFRFTTRATNGYVWPASHQAGSTAGAPPMGTRLRMKASVDLSGYAPELQKIFRAMKTYGLLLADNGTDMYIQGTMDVVWDNGVLNPAFQGLDADDFEVVRRGWNPASVGVP